MKRIPLTQRNRTYQIPVDDGSVVSREYVSDIGRVCTRYTKADGNITFAFIPTSSRIPINQIIYAKLSANSEYETQVLMKPGASFTELYLHSDSYRVFGGDPSPSDVSDIVNLIEKILGFPQIQRSMNRWEHKRVA